MLYKCSVCGYVFDEEKEGRTLAELEKCPVCSQPVDKFVPMEDHESGKEQSAKKKSSRNL